MKVERFRIRPVDALIGRPRVPDRLLRYDFESLEAEFGRLEFQAGVLRNRKCWDCGAEAGNRELNERLCQSGGKDRGWVPAYMLTPDGVAPDFSPQQQLQCLLKQGPFLAWLDPVAEGYSLREWCSGALLRALEAARIPVLLSYTGLDLDTLNEVLSIHPFLRVVLLDVPRDGRNRKVYPLLERHSGLWMCLSQAYSVAEGVEDLVRNFGPSRWVFGSGFPEAEGGAALLSLMAADIDDATRRAIAAENLESLLHEIRIEFFGG
ncbi:MAG: hypothetical protein JJU20_00265 [Opitutales bacterium]|nr:hypothetical protein [Opitutales bacterium]